MPGPHLLERLFGDYFPLVRHLVQVTAVFIVLLLCIAVARRAVPFLFPPTEYVSLLLHLVDGYAALLGIVGYTVWVGLDMFALLRKHGRRMVGDSRRDEEVRR